jgi:hypothetical protein
MDGMFDDMKTFRSFHAASIAPAPCRISGFDGLLKVSRFLAAPRLPVQGFALPLDLTLSTPTPHSEGSSTLRRFQRPRDHTLPRGDLVAAAADKAR